MDDNSVMPHKGMIVAIDPGTKTGVTYGIGERSITKSWDNKPVTKTKKRKGEPKYFRLKHLWDSLDKLLTYSLENEHRIEVIAFEGAQGFMRGKSAVEASHKFRAVIELFCSLNSIECVEIQPNDLKFFALGKRSGDKAEMIKAAQSMGYIGENDDEADSFLIYKWYQKHYTF